MITCLRYQAPADNPDRVLLVMLPGVGIEAEAFAAHGMVAAVQSRKWPVDVVATRPPLDLYLEGTLASALHEAVVEPALAAGYKRIWLLGISMGGMGALLYAAAHEPAVEGLILLAPFLGTPRTILEMHQAGGLATWSEAGSAATDMERRGLAWLRNLVVETPSRPRLYLGHGTDDRFAGGHHLLGAALRRNQVVTLPGGHDWETWAALWQALLDRQPFAALAPELDAGTSR